MVVEPRADWGGDGAGSIEGGGGQGASSDAQRDRGDNEVTCFFCSLTADRVVAANELCIAVRDGYPVSRGHTLVVTKRHVATWFDATADEQRALMALVAVVKAQLDVQYQPDGYNVGFNAGAAAGQTVMHLHLHVIPRYRGDVDDPRGGVRGVIPSKQKYGNAAAAAATAASATKASAEDRGPFAGLPRFVPGEELHFVEALRQALRLATHADLLSAFVQPSGVDLLKLDLSDALQRGAQVRVLTGDYLGVTSADGLRSLLQLANTHERCDARFFEATSTAFHPKSYVFHRGEHGVAYVGSSNLSASALQAGVEWNLSLVSDLDAEGFAQVQRRFEQLWADPRARRLTPELIADYERRVPVPLPPKPEPRAEMPKPHAVQVEALAALKQTRANDQRRGLVVMATGLGKTFLSALDFKAMGGERALFVAHREEILEQAREAWSAVHPDKSVGTLGMGKDEAHTDLVFASVQTLARKHHLSRFAADRFDYIVIDEFHHAAAATYKKVLAHFASRFLLGLTATPDRMDGAPLLALCHDNLVFRCNLVSGIAHGLLVPFRYFGVKDEVDFAPIPWRSGQFDVEALTQAVSTTNRAAQALREYRTKGPKGQRRTLAFCCSMAHADFMATYLREQGVPAAAVHSGPSSAPRADSLRRLRSGDLEVLCAVDVFNEGLDVPDINTVLMLRPTASPVIFLQQLGRGLRQSDGKTHLTVVDFIGNHRSFLQKPQGLVYLTGDNLAPAVALRRIASQQLELPPGCSVDIETAAIDMLQQFARLSKEDFLLYNYQSLRDTRGRRPTASELFGAGVHLRAVREHYKDWFAFVAAQGDLDEAAQQVHGRHRRWFMDLLTTKMTKAYKMLALEALLDDEGALFEGQDLGRNAELAHRSACENVLLFRELSEDGHRHPFGTAAVKKWREMPIGIWARGEDTQERWFELRDERFVPRYHVEDEDREAFESMTQELVELRLREHQDRLLAKQPADVDSTPAVLKVSHSANRPILRFDRNQRPDLPEGEVPVLVDGEAYVFRFVKIAVNLVTEQGSTANMLPLLMRRWFGPSAGLPGSRHRVQLARVHDRWQLSPLDHNSEETTGAEVLVFPNLPFYPDLKVACGAFAMHDRLHEAQTLIAVQTSHELDPSQHFVVRADGDSMNGGEHPIADGDLVLCELWTGRHEAETAGKTFLLLGHQAADSSFATMKVPIRQGNTWVLRSNNPAFPDQRLPTWAKLQPVAQVLEVVEEAMGLTLWGRYDRDAIAQAFGSRNDPSWKVGHRDIEVQGQPHTVLMVTLRKPQDTKLEHRYADQFLSRDEFQWQSQASTTAGSAKGQRIIHHADESRSLHLFVRYHHRDDYLYCGRVRYLRHEGNQPMTVLMQLERPLPVELWRVWKVN